MRFLLQEALMNIFVAAFIFSSELYEEEIKFMVLIFGAHSF